MLEALIRFVARLGEWGYLIVFGVAVLECAAFLGLLIPGESIVVFSGFLAERGVFDLEVIIPVAAIGATLGDNIGYEIGRRLGRPWLLRHGRLLKLRARHLDRAEAFFKRHGNQAVFLGRFIGFARALVPFVAGAARMKYRWFLLYNALGAMLWSVLAVLLGYFAGASWRVVERRLGQGGAIAGGLVLLALVAWWLWRRRKRKPAGS